MRKIFDGAHGTRLEQAAYTPDFMERFWRIGAEGFWKLERMQHYDEGDFPSYVAFRSGDWGHSLQLIEELRSEYEEEFGKITESGIGLRRVRVVERPVTPYIEWELNILHVKQEYGEQVSVLEAERVAQYERTEPLPELCVLGTEAVYVLGYTPAGVPDGATRFTQPDVVARSHAFLRELYAMGGRGGGLLPPGDRTLGSAGPGALSRPSGCGDDRRPAPLPKRGAAGRSPGVVARAADDPSPGWGVFQISDIRR